MRKIFQSQIAMNNNISYLSVQDNRELQNRITQNAETFGENEMRSMHEELAILEESGYKSFDYEHRTNLDVLIFYFTFLLYLDREKCVAVVYVVLTMMH